MDADQRESAVRSEPRAPACDPPQLLRRLISGYQATFLIQVAAELNLADLLADGPRGAEELATAAGCNPNALRRLLFALAQLEVFARRPDGRFELTPLGACLRSSHPDALNAFARYQAHAVIQQPWSGLLHSVRTGETAFEEVFGASLFDYLASRPDVAALFTSGMTARTAEHLGAIVGAYDWRNFETIIDVGGADGTLLTSILAAAPNARGIIFDQHRVRDAAERRITSEALQGRCAFAGGDFFAAVPSDADAYLFKYILHDWEDDQAVAILRNVRSAAPAHARLLVIEPLLMRDDQYALQTAMMDVAMLVVTGGRERSADEFAELYDRAGFRLTRILPTASPFCLVEGVPA
jgi:O-methyltransferase domain/Dimerisation domain